MKKWYLALAVLAASNAQAETIKVDLPACVSSELLGQMRTALTSNDRQDYDYLLGHGCFPLAPGMNVSVLEHGAELHLRVYAGNDAIELWAFPESIDPPI